MVQQTSITAVSINTSVLAMLAKMVISKESLKKKFSTTALSYSNGTDDLRVC